MAVRDFTKAELIARNAGLRAKCAELEGTAEALAKRVALLESKLRIQIWRGNRNQETSAVREAMEAARAEAIRTGNKSGVKVQLPQ